MLLIITVVTSVSNYFCFLFLLLCQTGICNVAFLILNYYSRKLFFSFFFSLFEQKFGFVSFVNVIYQSESKMENTLPELGSILA